MLTHNYSYEAALSDSVKVNWQVQDLIGGDKRLDFSKPFLPESLAQVRSLETLSAREKLLLNQIRGNSYLYLFSFVEEFILPFVTDEARAAMLGGGDINEVRAMMTFGDEEAKHIHLFTRFAEEFKAGFHAPCGVIGPAVEVAKVVLSHSRLGVALLTLHLEWMTQAHYVDSVKDDQDLDSQFANLLKHHWMEEAQHAKLDTLLVEGLAAKSTPAEIEQGVEDYLKIGMFIDGGLEAQTKFDLEALAKVTGRKLSESQSREAFEVQRQANRWTYLGSGMTHPNFIATLGGIAPAGRKKVEGIAPAFC